MSDQRPRLFGMITTAASIDYTVEALRSFFLYTDFEPTDRFVLIDNDGAWSAKPRFARVEIDVSKNVSPCSFAKNANAFLRVCLEEQRDLFLLNNDLIFTKDWTLPLDRSGTSICCPLSNREVQYIMATQVAKSQAPARVFTSSMEMSLEQYRGAEFAIQALAETHRANSVAGFMPVIVMPYFCVRIPVEIIQAVGFFDEDYGRGGGEDYDYSLRAHLAGFPVHYALGAWIVHFYGKSSWSGVEAEQERAEREKKMLAYFDQRWGPILKELLFSEKESLIAEHGFPIPQTPAEFAALIVALRDKGKAL